MPLKKPNRTARDRAVVVEGQAYLRSVGIMVVATLSVGYWDLFMKGITIPPRPLWFKVSGCARMISDVVIGPGTFWLE